MLYTKIFSYGSYLPEKILTNDELSKIVDTTDEWIIQRTGIKERHIAADNEFTSDMATKALKNALGNGNISANDLDMIIIATTTPDLLTPSTACIVQNKIDANNAVSFDIQAACSGFVYATTIADKFIKSGSHKKIAVIGVDKMSSILDWTDRNTCVLFGDGAGCIIYESSDDYGIIDSMIHSDGNYCDILNTTGGIGSNKQIGCMAMNGKEVFKHAIMKMSDSITEILNKNNLSLDDVKLIIPHQANYRIISAVAERLQVAENKFICTLDKHSNTSAATIPLAFCEAINQNLIVKKDLIIFEALGAGLTWGGILLRF